MSVGTSLSFDSMSNFPNGFSQGVQIQGLPVLNTYPGRVFWLHSLTGADGNPGTFQKPFASLSGALSNMASPAPTAYADLLMTKAGHAETVSSATALAVNMSGVKVVGMGIGLDRPTWTLDTADTATITIRGQGTTFMNCRFVANFANIASMFTLANASVTASLSGTTLTVSAVGSGTLFPGSTLVSATSGFQAGTRIIRQISGTTGGVGAYQVNKSQTVASGTVTTSSRDFSLRGCEVYDTSAILNALIVVTASGTDNGSDGLQLVGNTVFLKATSGVVDLLAGTSNIDRLVVANNNYRARTTGAGAVIPMTAGKLLTNATICDNIFDTVNAAGTATALLITTNQTTHTGVICRNYMQSLDATTELLVTASSGFVFFDNKYSGAADASGYLLPAADS